MGGTHGKTKIERGALLHVHATGIQLGTNIHVYISRNTNVVGYTRVCRGSKLQSCVF